MLLALIGGASVLAGLLQGVTGFGANIILVVVLSQFFSVVECAGIGQSICLAITIGMAWHYRRYIHLNEIIVPAIAFLAVSWSSILIAEELDPALMKLVLGIFLVILAIYFLFIQKDQTEQREPSLPVAIGCIVISGICDGLFGIGGPLMVVYYLNKMHTKEEYLGTVQTFFGITTLMGVLFRIARGILLPSFIPVIVMGMIFVLVGLTVANRIVTHLNTQTVKTLTYGVIGLAGIYNAAGALMLLM